MCKRHDADIHIIRTLLCHCLSVKVSSDEIQSENNTLCYLGIGDIHQFATPDCHYNARRERHVLVSNFSSHI